MSEYRWENEHGKRTVHEGSGIVFEVFEDGHGQSIAGPSVGLEILRLRDALAAERARAVENEQAAAWYRGMTMEEIHRWCVGHASITEREALNRPVEVPESYFDWLGGREEPKEWLAAVAQSVRAERERCAGVCEAVAAVLRRDADKLGRREGGHSRAVAAYGKANQLLAVAAKIRQG
jgi:hypothetical protein